MDETNEDYRKVMWSRGDYRVVGDWFREASVACLDEIDLRGKRLLDVACGTGSVAIAAAHRGAKVVGVDLTPSMLQEAERRASAEGLDIEWREASYEDLGAFRGFDVVTSAFGAVFANDAKAVMGELRSAGAERATLSLAAWGLNGAFGDLPRGIVTRLPELRNGPRFRSWSTEEGLRSLIADTDGALHLFRPATMRIPFTSVEHAADEIIRWSGPWQMIFEALEARNEVDQARSELIEHLASFSESTNEGVDLVVDYVIAHVQFPGR